jgi:DNA-binding SARP family transcriptional activator
MSGVSHDHRTIPRQIRRTALTTRLSLGAPRIVAAIAPAGYGKSAAIRQYAETFASVALCDCRDVRSGVDFAARVAGVLVGGDPSRERALAEQRMADTGDAAVWAGLMLDAWAESTAHELFVFENAEDLADSVERIDLLARLLARTPARRQVAICSRRALPLSLSRFALPHELVTLREEQLAFDVHEIADAFREVALPAGALEQIARITRGWPVAVLLFLRLAREGSLTKALGVSRGLEFVDLYDYLVEQVFAVLTPAQFERLVAIASIPGARGEEIALVLDDPSAARELVMTAQVSPFVYQVGEDVYEAHPLARASLLERYPERCHAMQLRAADRLAETRPLRGAQLYQAAGAGDRAAALLEGQYELFINEVPPLFAEVVAKIDERELLRHGGLWAAATAVRSGAIPQRQWLYEALAVREDLPADAPLATRVGVLVSLGNVLTNLGRHDEALEIFANLAPPGVTLPERYRGVQLLFEASVAARMGRFGEAARLWAQGEPYFAEVAFTRALGFEEVAARIVRFADRTRERSLLDLSVALARESGAATVLALVLQEATFAAWFAGEDALFEQYALELENGIRPNTAAGTEVVRAAVRGDVGPLQRREQVERPRFRCYAALIACAATSGEVRAACAQRALEAATSAAEPAYVAIASIACAEASPGERDTHLAHARAAVAAVESPELQAAVEAYARGSDEFGPLAPFVRRLRGRRAPTSNESAEALTLSIFDGTIRRNGEPIALSNRERELLTYLALHRRPCSRQELLEAIWPNRAGPSDSLIRVCIRRVRERLRDPAIIRGSSSGEYRLGADVRVDLEDAERLVRLAAREPVLAADVRERLEACARATQGAMPAALAAWDWIAPFAPRLEELARAVVLRLGHDALARARHDDAREYADRVLVHDPCDEPAWELLIRALLAGDGLAAAQRAFRKYRDVLAAELGAEPSAELAQLAGAVTAL